MPNRLGAIKMSKGPLPPMWMDETFYETTRFLIPQAQKSPSIKREWLKGSDNIVIPLNRPSLFHGFLSKNRAAQILNMLEEDPIGILKASAFFRVPKVLMGSKEIPISKARQKKPAYSFSREENITIIRLHSLKKLFINQRKYGPTNGRFRSKT